MNEAGFLLEEGNCIESIDKAMVDFGMPVGPVALLDEVGIDVAAKVAGILYAAFKDRMPKSKVVDTLFEKQRYGKKNNKGLYVYDQGRRKGPDAEVYRLFGVTMFERGVSQLVSVDLTGAAEVLESKVA